jgi:hypothetical protein
MKDRKHQEIFAGFFLATQIFKTRYQMPFNNKIKLNYTIHKMVVATEQYIYQKRYHPKMREHIYMSELTCCLFEVILLHSYKGKETCLFYRGFPAEEHKHAICNISHNLAFPCVVGF